MRRTHALPLLALLPLSLAFAQPAIAGEDTQHWETANLTVALPDNFKFNSETVFRTSDAKGFYEIEENAMIGKKLNKKVTAWLGYTYDPLYLHGTFQRSENRFRQQVSFDNALVLGKVKIGGRMRLEERWRQGFAGTGWRLRPQIKATAPFIGKSTLSLSSEPFIELNTNGFQRHGGLERMRNAIAVAVPLNKKFTIDFGYLNQHGFVSNAPDSSDHVLTLGLSASL